MPERLLIDISPTERVTAIAYCAAPRNRAGVGLLLAHGAGANQASGFMVRFATALAERGIDTATFNFIYSEQGRRVPDRNDKLEACYRAVIEAARSGALKKAIGHETLAIGGKSMGGRIATQVAAGAADDVAGLVILGYPLHPPGRPDKLRMKHLPAIRAPLLILQGARDAFGTPDELTPIIKAMQAPVDLRVIEDGDHSFKVPKKAAMSQEQVYDFMLDEIEQWLRGKALM